MERRAFHQQFVLEQELQYANKLLRNILPSDVISRFKSGEEFPIADKFEQATVAAVEIVFGGGNCDDYLVALDDIFCVSINR